MLSLSLKSNSQRSCDGIVYVPIALGILDGLALSWQPKFLFEVPSPKLSIVQGCMDIKSSKSTFRTSCKRTLDALDFF